MQISTFSRIKVEFHIATKSFNDIILDTDHYHVTGVNQTKSIKGDNIMITHHCIAVYDNKEDAIAVANKLSELLGVEYDGEVTIYI